MRRTIAEIQKCKPGLCLPEKAEETLTVFNVVDQLQTLLMELEKVCQSVNSAISDTVKLDAFSQLSFFSVSLFLQKVPALFIQQPPTPVQAKVSAKLEKSTSEVAEVSLVKKKKGLQYKSINVVFVQKKNLN